MPDTWGVTINNVLSYTFEGEEGLEKPGLVEVKAVCQKFNFFKVVQKLLQFLSLLNFHISWQKKEKKGIVGEKKSGFLKRMIHCETDFFTH